MFCLKTLNLSNKNVAIRILSQANATNFEQNLLNISFQQGFMFMVFMHVLQYLIINLCTKQSRCINEKMSFKLCLITQTLKLTSYT